MTTQNAYNEPDPERLPADQQTIDAADKRDAYYASAPHIQPSFNYVDCKESIQEDLMALFDSFGLPRDTENSVAKELLTKACQIVVDNFDKVNLKTNPVA